MGNTVASGAAESFDQFFRTRYGEAVRLAHLLTGSNLVAEDLAQEAFSRIRGRYAGLEHPAGYLFTTVTNVCRTWHRSQSRERATLIRSRVLESTYELAADEMSEAIKRLPYRQRAVVVLRYWMSLSEAEIAATLHCRPGTVKSLLSRALDALRTEFPND